MMIPDDGSKTRKWVLPAKLFQGGLIFASILTLLIVMLLLNYLHLLTEVAENKKLRIENRKISQTIKGYHTKLESVDQNIQRLKNFSTKLRVLGNLGDVDNDNISAPSDFLDPFKDMDSDEDNINENNAKDVIDETSNNKKITPIEENDQLKKQPQIQSKFSNDEDRSSNKSINGYLDVANRFDIVKNKNLDTQMNTTIEATNELLEIGLQEEELMAQLYEHLQDKVDLLIHTPSIIPTKGWISSRYGYRHNPFVRKKSFHAGLDIAAAVGTPVYAPADGKIRSVGMMGGFGKVVIIDHGYEIVTKYGHNSKLHVKKNQKVKRGQKIASVGSTGRSTGPHLHYQIEVKGKPVNPENFILDAFLN